MRASGLIFAHLITLMISAVSAAELQRQTPLDLKHESCPFIPIAASIDFDRIGTSARNVKLPRMSSEGGAAWIYEQDGQIRFIHAALYGETGRTEFTYQFRQKGRQLISVMVSKYGYTEPISSAQTLIAATTIQQFTVCSGKVPNFPRLDLLGDSPEMALHILDHLVPSR